MRMFYNKLGMGSFKDWYIGWDTEGGGARIEVLGAWIGGVVWIA